MDSSNNQSTNLLQYERSDFEFLNDLAEEMGVSYFNFRVNEGQSTEFKILNGVSKISKSGFGQGFSLQTFVNGGWGFSIGNEYRNKEEIIKKFKESAKLAKFSSKYAEENYSLELPETSITKYIEMPLKKPLNQMGPDEKIRFLLDLEGMAKINDKIETTRINFRDSEGISIVFNGSNFFKKKRSNVFMIFEAIAADGSNRQRFHTTHGGFGGIEILESSTHIAEKSATNALELLNSKAIPSGKYDIIIDPALTGTFIHEAFGHACEADGVLAGESLLAGKIGERVGKEQINVYDDPSLEKEFGYSVFDSEAIISEKTTLVEGGILKNFLHSIDTSSKMGVNPTGNGRAAGAGSKPIVRMTNTYLDGGDSSLDEMIQEMQNGVLCIGWNYGYTNPADGSFMFKMAKGYLIENGEKTQVIRDAAISGQTLEVLDRIMLLGKNIEMDPGHCGKGGQSVPVGSGGPFTYIKDMVIGGQ